MIRIALRHVRCSDCAHGSPATPADPWSWHSCAAGTLGAFGMVRHPCERHAPKTAQEALQRDGSSDPPPNHSRTSKIAQNATGSDLEASAKGGSG